MSELSELRQAYNGCIDLWNKHGIRGHHSIFEWIEWLVERNQKLTDIEKRPPGPKPENDLAKARHHLVRLMECLDCMDIADQDTLIYWRSHDEACAGVAERWRQALEDPIPNPGVLGDETLEALYRRTEALRASLATERAAIAALSQQLQRP